MCARQLGSPGLGGRMRNGQLWLLLRNQHAAACCWPRLLVQDTFWVNVESSATRCELRPPLSRRHGGAFQMCVLSRKLFEG